MLKRLITVCLILTSGATFGQSVASKYIDAYKEAAIQVMNEHGVPASIILGVAIHESASGTSKIARYLNNHFGIKGKGGPKKISSSYKGYESVEDSYIDFVNTLKKRSAFNRLFEVTSSNYKTWVKGIQRGGYAQSSTWGQQVIAIINKYKLYEFDGNNPAGLSEEAQSTTYAELQAENKSYRVKKGDSLARIAKIHQTTVKSIQKKNRLKTTHLKPGQELIL
jgi:flagellum-specific peptidoglycan hydrolase FlgJ